MASDNTEVQTALRTLKQTINKLIDERIAKIGKQGAGPYKTKKLLINEMFVFIENELSSFSDNPTAESQASLLQRLKLLQAITKGETQLIIDDKAIMEGFDNLASMISNVIQTDQRKDVASTTEHSIKTKDDQSGQALFLGNLFLMGTPSINKMKVTLQSQEFFKKMNAIVKNAIQCGVPDLAAPPASKHPGERAVMVYIDLDSTDERDYKNLLSQIARSLELNEFTSCTIVAGTMYRHDPEQLKNAVEKQFLVELLNKLLREIDQIKATATEQQLEDKQLVVDELRNRIKRIDSYQKSTTELVAEHIEKCQSIETQMRESGIKGKGPILLSDLANVQNSRIISLSKSAGSTITLDEVKQQIKSAIVKTSFLKLEFGGTEIVMDGKKLNVSASAAYVHQKIFVEKEQDWRQVLHDAYDRRKDRKRDRNSERPADKFFSWLESIETAQQEQQQVKAFRK